ncbi:MAG TPA: FAD-dependent oxidoreductase [Kofleriaceae bacterium]|nr:FAD-dependent oxidoreductase [Kofleriaceae bacterium]
MKATSVVVVGGGLAGMVAALRLLERGCAVDIYEASERLGGKAGTGLGAEPSDDHGYHIFPMWYRNIWKLVDELGLARSFVDCDGFLQMSAEQYPKGPSYRNLTSLRYAWHNLRAGVTPLPHTFLFFYAALDLMSQPYSYRAALDRVTVSGFLRSRPYRTEQISDQFEELMLKGISVPTYQVSAMTMRNVMRYWFRYPEPMLRILDGSLHDKWILPLQRRIEQLGGKLHFGHRLERLEIRDNALTGLMFRRAGAEPAAVTVEVDRAILAIPCEKLWPMLDDSVIASVPELAKTRYLRSLPMAALNLYFDRRIPQMPRGHINLLGSAYALSFIDVSAYWPQATGSVLQVIASDVTALGSASPAYAERCILDELTRRIPALDEVTLVRSNFLPHLEEPLFMNDVGAWTYRPDAATSLPNLYLAGDYCRSAIDLVSMEGAVSTGLLAAEAVRRAAGLAEPVEVLVPEVPARWVLVLGRLALFPHPLRGGGRLRSGSRGHVGRAWVLRLRPPSARARRRLGRGEGGGLLLWRSHRQCRPCALWRPARRGPGGTVAARDPGGQGHPGRRDPHPGRDNRRSAHDPSRLPGRSSLLHERGVLVRGRRERVLRNRRPVREAPRAWRLHVRDHRRAGQRCRPALVPRASPGHESPDHDDVRACVARRRGAGLSRRARDPHRRCAPILST